MKSRVLIYVESLIRDVAPARVIARQLEAKGHAVALASAPSFNFMLRAWRPHHVLHGQPGMVVGNFENGLIGPDHGPLVSIFPQEGMHTRTEELRSWYGPFEDPALAKTIDCIYFWNDFERDWVSRETALKDDQLVVSGGMRLDMAKFAGRRKIETPKKRIGFIGRFTYMNRLDETPLGYRAVVHPEGISDTATEEEVQWLETQYRTLNCFSRIIDYLVRNTDYTCVIRGHQAEAGNGPIYKLFKRKYGNRVEIDRSQSIYHWAINKDVLISTNSTSLLEPYLGGVPIVNVDRLTRSSDVVSGGALSESNEPLLLRCYDPDLIPMSFDDLYRMIDDCVSGTFRHRPLADAEEYLERFLNWPYQGAATKTISNGIDNAVRRSVLEERPVGRSLLPAIFGDLYYFYNVMFRMPGSLSGMKSTFYNSLLHKDPDFLEEVQRNIEKAIAEGPSAENAEQTDSSETAAA